MLQILFHQIVVDSLQIGRATYTYLHWNYVTRASWPHKSESTQLFFQIMTDWLVKVRFTGFCEGSGWITYKFLIGKFYNAEIVSIAWHHHYLYPSRMVFKWGRASRINIVMRHSWIVDITGSLPNTIHDIRQSWHQDINVNGGAPHTIIYGDL